MKYGGLEFISVEEIKLLPAFSGGVSNSASSLFSKTNKKNSRGTGTSHPSLYGNGHKADRILGYKIEKGFFLRNTFAES